MSNYMKLIDEAIDKRIKDTHGRMPEIIILNPKIQKQLEKEFIDRATPLSEILKLTHIHGIRIISSEDVNTFEVY